MLPVRSEDIRAVLEDFKGKPTKSGQGKWDQIRQILKFLRDEDLSGMLILKRRDEELVLFYDYGKPIEGMILKEAVMALDSDHIHETISRLGKVKAYVYSFYPYPSEVILVLSLVHKSTRIMDTLISDLKEVFSHLEGIEFSGILKCKEPVGFSQVFLNGMRFAMMSGGTPLREDQVSGESLYSVVALSVEDTLRDRSTKNFFSKYASDLRGIYKSLSRSDPYLYLKFRKRQLSHENPYLNPYLGFVEAKPNDLVIRVPLQVSLKVLADVCDLMADIGGRYKSKLLDIKTKIEEVI